MYLQLLTMLICALCLTDVITVDNQNKLLNSSQTNLPLEPKRLQ